MEKELKAFFYEYKYYLLPEECGSVEDLKKQKTWEVKRLKEELCMAPNFVYESMETEFLTIEDFSLVFPAEANLYPCEEYDEILRKQVDCVCPKCVRYTDDGDPSLNGHHREISLDGVCYLRETEDERWSFAYCAEVFWYRIAKRTEELLKYIEKNKQEKIEKLFSEELEHFFLPNDVYAGYDENGPCIAFYANDYGCFPGIRLILKELADVANAEGSPMKEEGWTVYPYLPKGMAPVCKKPDYVQNPPRLFMRIEEGTDEVNVRFYEPKLNRVKEKTAMQMSEAAYQYICYCVGEDVLLGGCSTYQRVGGIPEDMQEVTPEELEKALLTSAEIEDRGVPFPAPMFMGEYDEEPEMLPFKQNLQFAMTVCPEYSPEKKNENMEGGNTIFESFGIVYAYLYMPKGNSEADFEERMNAFHWYLEHIDEYPEPIGDGEKVNYMKHAGRTFAKEGICEDLMVFDEKAFFRWMRHLTPVLQGLNVKIVTVKRNGTVVYDPGYRIVAEGSDWLN